HTLPFAVPDANTPPPAGPVGAWGVLPGARTASTPTAAAITATPQLMSASRRAQTARRRRNTASTGAGEISARSTSPRRRRRRAASSASFPGPPPALSPGLPTHQRRAHPQLGQRPPRLAAHRTLRAPEQRGHLGVAQVPPVAQHDDGALPRWQAPQRGHQI